MKNTSTSSKHLSPKGASGVILRTKGGRLDTGPGHLSQLHSLDHWVLTRCSGHRGTTGSQELPDMGLPLKQGGSAG